MAFQIKDDLFDFGTDDVGKPRGIDIREKKITLPLIYSLNKADKAMRKRMISIVKNYAEESGRVQAGIAFVKTSGGLQSATEVMNRFQDDAFGLRHPFPVTGNRDL